MSRTRKAPYFCPTGKRRCPYCNQRLLVRFKVRRATGAKR